MEYKRKRNSWRHWASLPFIWGMIIPIGLFDLSLELYHQVAFRLYQIPLVKRKDFISVSRARLAYIALDDRINCAYCSYSNGLFRYAAEISARTELYWCGIQAEEDRIRSKMPHHKKFVPYGDEKAFKRRYDQRV